MSEPPAASSASGGNAVSAAIKALPAWKKTLAVLSMGVATAGAAGAGYVALSDGGAATKVREINENAPAGSDTALVTGLVASDTATQSETDEETEPSALGDWSPAIFRMGFAFFVGFVIAYALRTFVKITLVVLGVLILLLIGLQQVGVIEINWNQMEDHYDSIADWLSSQTDSLKGFLTGYLPSSASAVGGLVVGFKK